MLLRPLKFAPQLLRLSATPLSLPSRSLLTKSSATQSPVLSVPRVLKRSITRSAPTLTKQVCKEINYGYAEDTHEVEPVTYAPTPAPY